MLMICLATALRRQMPWGTPSARPMIRSETSLPNGGLHTLCDMPTTARIAEFRSLRPVTEGHGMRHCGSTMPPPGFALRRLMRMDRLLPIPIRQTTFRSALHMQEEDGLRMYMMKGGDMSAQSQVTGKIAPHLCLMNSDGRHRFPIAMRQSLWLSPLQSRRRMRIGM